VLPAVRLGGLRDAFALLLTTLGRKD